MFGDVDAVDAFTGMVSEPHVEGTEFGELQLAMWTRQFEALRDGDRFFYANDPALDEIADQYGIDYRMTLADVIAANTDAEVDELATNVFLLDAMPVATNTGTGATADAGATTTTDDEATTDAAPTPADDPDVVGSEQRTDRPDRLRDRGGRPHGRDADGRQGA